MSATLPLARPVPRRPALLFALSAFWLMAAATGVAPTLARSVAPSGPALTCHCAHCKGGAACCCRSSAACPKPLR